MHWNTVKPGIKSLIADISGLTTRWEDEPRPFEMSANSTPAICLLSIGSVVDLGTGEIKQSPVQGKIQETHISQKRIAITIKVQSEVHTDGGSAESYCEKIRGELRFRGSRERLISLNCAVNQILQSVPLPSIKDDRARSQAAFDLVLNCRAEMADPNLVQVIESTTIAGTLTPGNISGQITVES